MADITDKLVEFRHKDLIQVRKFLKLRLFGWLYMTFSLLVVLATTLYWALLGARVQLSNADQLVDNDLFKNLATFRGATFPSAHTLLLKWPIFLLIKLFGSTDSVINVFTVGLVLLTVALLIAIIYRIEKRPLVFGTICLALASVLLLVPAAPYAGALLPVNMAMLTTRNIEYIVFIAGLALLAFSPRIKSWGFWISVVALSLLFASDKLFLIFTIGGALVALVIYARTKAWALVSLATNWLILGILAAIGAYIILALISRSGLTHLSSLSSSSPYNLIDSFKQLSLGIIYAVFGLLTNFGANPAFNATEVKNIPHQLVTRLFSLSGPGYVINILILLAGLVAVYKVLKASWAAHRSDKKLPLDKSRLLSVMLIWSSVAAIISFVVTNHYYTVDARYLTIVLFTVFITLAAYIRTKKWHPEVLVGAGLLVVIGIIFGTIGATRNYNDDTTALASQNSRNLVIAQVLKQHHVDTLVGDYWRVVPIKQVAVSSLNITPLSNCTQAQQVLSSSLWRPNLNHTQFAYLLTLQGSLTNYPNCSLQQVTNVYGKPDTSTLVNGTLSQPKELLLFYDRGIHKSSPVTPGPANSPSTVLPISLSELPDTSCSGLSVMNLVAHEDDDLLFMNPDLTNNIQAGYCVRTVYVTAGNAGQDSFYWLSREQGSEAAYDIMLGLSTNTLWVQRIVELSSHEFITIANPKGNAKISLIFMCLPDGNLKGQGFSSSAYESIAKLYAGAINTITSVDNQSYYTSAQLTDALSTLMATYRVMEINTQSDLVGTRFPDHSDHLTVSRYVKQAYEQYETRLYANQVVIPIKFYIGYPVHQMLANVNGAALQEKEAAFLAYAKFDGGTCQTLQQCSQTPTYDAYLTRQYQNAY